MFSAVFRVSCGDIWEAKVLSPRKGFFLYCWTTVSPYMPASILYSSHVAFLNHHFMTQCDIILSTPWPTGLILSYDIGVNLTRAIKRGEIPRWGFTLLFTVSLILHRGIIPNHPVSGGNKGYSAHEVVGSPVYSEIRSGSLQLRQHRKTWGPVVAGRGGRPSLRPLHAETHLRIMFSYNPKLLVTTSPWNVYPLMLSYCAQRGQMICWQRTSMWATANPGLWFRMSQRVVWHKKREEGEVGGGWLWLHWAL